MTLMASKIAPIDSASHHPVGDAAWTTPPSSVLIWRTGPLPRARTRGRLVLPGRRARTRLALLWERRRQVRMPRALSKYGASNGDTASDMHKRPRIQKNTRREAWLAIRRPSVRCKRDKNGHLRLAKRARVFDPSHVGQTQAAGRALPTLARRIGCPCSSRYWQGRILGRVACQ
jgi:hypothetical protein